MSDQGADVQADGVEIDAPEEVTADAPDVREVFNPARDIGDPRENLQREWVVMPEWGGMSVCVWALSARAEGKILIAAGDPEKEPTERYALGTQMRICRSVFDGDTTDAQQLFTELNNGDWLMNQPDSAITRLVEVNRRLNGKATMTTEELQAFFVMIPQVVECLIHTASASGACTSCPKNSQPTCLRTLYKKLSPQTGFFGSQSTDDSARSAAGHMSETSDALSADDSADE